MVMPLYLVTCKCGYYKEKEIEVESCPKCGGEVEMDKVYEYKYKCHYCNKSFFSSRKNDKECLKCYRLMWRIGQKKFIQMTAKERIEMYDRFTHY